MSKPSLPKGTRDFSSDTVRKRNYILNTIRQVFELYGFQPLETPAIENLDTLMGKYGEEGDKLIFRILNNGLSDPKNEQKSRAAFEQVMQGKNDKNLTERALRYDLTIPFARYVAMNYGQLVLPFKRYQIQPVWRAENTQKSRYREFYQCDADVVGSRSLVNEVEFVQIYHQVFMRLGLAGYELQINSRNILVALSYACGGPEKLASITVAIDKLDKVGLVKVKEELITRGLKVEEIEIIERYLSISGTNDEKIEQVKALFATLSAEGKHAAEQGVRQLEEVVSIVNPSKHQVPLVVDFNLARGLSYYTGIIFEVRAPGTVKIGSIGGGGRYDDLTGLFGVPDVPGVGISFGVDRIYDVMEELNLFPGTLNIGTQILLYNLPDPVDNFPAMPKRESTIFELAGELREAGFRVEIYPDQHHLDKQYKYAKKRGIPFVVSIGRDATGTLLIPVKNILTGQNYPMVPRMEMVDFFSAQLPRK